MASPVQAHNYKTGKLEILHPVIAASPPGTSVVAGYLTITNDGDDDDRLLYVSASFAGAAGVHQSVIDNEVARMRELQDGLLLPAKSTVALTPGDIHLMFEQLRSELVLDELYEVTLTFEHAAERTVQFWVKNSAEQEQKHVMHEEDAREHSDHSNKK